MERLPIIVAAFRAWIAAHLDGDRDVVIESVCSFCASENGAEGAGAALLAVAVWLGVRHDRIFALLIRALPHDPILVCAALELYGDPQAVPYLEALIDRHVVTPDTAAELRALVRAIVRLGGVLSFARGAKLIDAMGVEACARFGELLHELTARLCAEPNALDALDGLPMGPDPGN